MYSYEKCVNRTDIYLNIYDLHDINNYLWNIGLGIYYSGLEIYNNEYSYIYIKGICVIKPRSLKGINFREKIRLGSTEKTEIEIKNIINDLRKEFPAESYHPIYNNFNHFTNELSRLLTGNNIPDYLNRLSWANLCLSNIITKKLYLIYNNKNINSDPEEEPLIEKKQDMLLINDKENIENENNIITNSNNNEDQVKINKIIDSYTLI